MTSPEEWSATAPQPGDPEPVDSIREAFEVWATQRFADVYGPGMMLDAEDLFGAFAAGRTREPTTEYGEPYTGGAVLLLDDETAEMRLERIAQGHTGPVARRHLWKRQIVVVDDWEVIP